MDEEEEALQAPEENDQDIREMFVQESEAPEEEEQVSLEQHTKDLDALEENVAAEEEDTAKLLADPELAQVNTKFFSSIRRWVKRAVHNVKRTAKKSWSTIKREAARAGQTIKKVGGKIVKVATRVFNSFVNKARSVGRDITSAIRKIDLIKYVKTAVNNFFKVTESCTFERIFRATVGRIMLAFKFS